MIGLDNLQVITVIHHHTAGLCHPLGAFICAKMNILEDGPVAKMKAGDRVVRPAIGPV